MVDFPGEIVIYCFSGGKFYHGKKHSHFRGGGGGGVGGGELQLGRGELLSDSNIIANDQEDR